MATVILLDSERLDDELAGRAPAAGLLPLAGRPLVRYAAEAFGACGDIEQVVLAGPPAYAAHLGTMPEIDETLLSEAPLADQVLAALERFGDTEELIFWPANGPLITPEIVEEFLGATPLAADVCWTMVRGARFDATYPAGLEVWRHTVAGEELVVAALGLVKPQALNGQLPLLRRLLANDFGRSDWLRMLGVGFTIKFQTGRVGLEELARRVSEVLELRCVLQIVPSPEAAFRVRTRQEHHLARACLEGE